MSAAVLTRRDALRILRADTKNKDYQSSSRLGEAVAQYLAWKEMSGAKPRTLEAYEYILARLCQMNPDVEITGFDASMLLEAIGTLPPASRRTRGSVPVSDFFKWATAWKRLQYNPAQLLPDFKVESDQIYELFTVEERANLIRAASIDTPRENRIPVRDRAGVLLFLDTGARKTDVRLLQWRDVDTAGRFVIFRHRKGGKQDIVPFGLDLQQALIDAFHSEYPCAAGTPQPDDYLLYPNGFTGRMVTWVKPTKPMSDGTVQRWWYRILRRAGIVEPDATSGRNLHLTRHTHGTETYEATGDIVQVKDRLGHASTRTSEIYVHNSKRRGRASVDAIELYRKTLAEPESE